MDNEECNLLFQDWFAANFRCQCCLRHHANSNTKVKYSVHIEDFTGSRACLAALQCTAFYQGFYTRTEDQMHFTAEHAKCAESSLRNSAISEVKKFTQGILNMTYCKRKGTFVRTHVSLESIFFNMKTMLLSYLCDL